MHRLRPLDALAGAIAFVLAHSLAELFAAVLMVVSPRVAVGDTVIRLAPLDAVHFATRTFGTNDKPALLATIVVITVAFGALIGAIARRRPDVAFYGFGLWWAVCATAVWVDQTQPAAAAGIVGVAALGGWWSLRLLLGRSAATLAPAPAPAPAVIPPSDPRTRTPDRRAFLGFAAASVGVSAAALVGARRFGGRAVDVVAQRMSIMLPKAQQPLPAVAKSATLDDVPGIAPLVTPNEHFYRIDTALSVPRVDVEKWQLKITGMVERPQTFSYADLTSMVATEADVTLACVSNEVGDELVGNARWIGIPLPVLLERAGVKPGATQIVGRSVDGFTAGFPTEVALDGRMAMVALGMNGEPLPAEHGFPARLVIPGLYGYVSATKWLAQIELTTLEAFDAYWIPRGWSKQAPIKTQSRIDVPFYGRTIAAGKTPVAGVAWGGIRSVSKVEVRILPIGEYEGPWREARLSEALSKSTWRQWVYEWDAAPGEYDISVRATDGNGDTQTDRIAPPDPDGATGYHKVRVKVAK